MPTTSAKPEFIIVPGAWHQPSAFQPTTVVLEQAGFVTHVVTLPSVGATPGLSDFSADVLAIRSKINEVLSSGKDAVLAVHSYGGVAGSEALSEYMRELREGKRREGWGIVRRIVYIAAFVLPEGASLFDGVGGAPPWLVLNEADGTMTCSTPYEVFYGDISPAVAAPYIASLKHHSIATFASKLTVAPWKVIPTTYVLCEADNAIPVLVQEKMIEDARQRSQTAFDVVERSSAAHSPFISQPEWLAEKLMKAAAI